MDGGLAPDPVGERTENNLTNAESKEHSRNDELDIVPMHHPEVPADRRQRRQHRIDRKRDQRRQQRDERNEFPHTKGRCGGGWGHSCFQGARAIALVQALARVGQMGLEELYFVEFLTIAGEVSIEG